MTLHPLAGVYVAAVTPLDVQGQLQLDDLPALINFYVQQGVHGILFLGTTGEGPSFSPAERIALFRAAAQARADHPQLRLLAGTGTPSLTETSELTQAAFAEGFDGVVVLPPFYFRSASEEGLFAWFDALIRAAVPPEKFLLGYHIPGVSGVELSIPLLARLKAAHPRRFAGIKDSSHNSAHAQALGAAFGSDLLVLNGTDSYLSLAMQHGAQGCITAPANLMARALRQIWEAQQDGQPHERLQDQVTQLREILESAPPFPPILKALLHRLYRMPRWTVRPPLVPAAAETVENLAARIRPLLEALP